MLYNVADMAKYPSNLNTSTSGYILVTCGIALSERYWYTVAYVAGVLITGGLISALTLRTRHGPLSYRRTDNVLPYTSSMILYIAYHTVYHTVLDSEAFILNTTE